MGILFPVVRERRAEARRQPERADPTSFRLSFAGVSRASVGSAALSRGSVLFVPMQSPPSEVAVFVIENALAGSRPVHADCCEQRPQFLKPHAITPHVGFVEVDPQIKFVAGGSLVRRPQNAALQAVQSIHEFLPKVAM